MRTDFRDADMQHRRLRRPHYKAKLMGAATVSQCEVLKKRLQKIAVSYPREPANKLASAVDHLFTLLLHEGMEPTNGPAERENRTPAMHCKVRSQIGGKGKMSRFGILLTCILTWRKQKLNFYREVDRILQIHA